MTEHDDGPEDVPGDLVFTLIKDFTSDLIEVRNPSAWKAIRHSIEDILVPLIPAYYVIHLESLDPEAVYFSLFLFLTLSRGQAAWHGFKHSHEEENLT